MQRIGLCTAGHMSNCFLQIPSRPEVTREMNLQEWAGVMTNLGGSEWNGFEIPR